MDIRKDETKLQRLISLAKERTDLAMKEKGFDGIISRKINRKISAPIAQFLYAISKNIDPNYLTFVTGIIGVGTGILFMISNGNPLYASMGGILIQFVSIADGIDGDYARRLPEIVRKDTEKSFGQYLDTMTDKIVDATIIYGIGVYLTYVFPKSFWVFPLIFATMNFSLLRSYIRGRIIKTYTKHREMKYYTFNKINFVERDVVLLILAFGGLLEGLYYVIPSAKGIPLTLSIIVIFLLYFSYVINSFFELKRNLNNIETIEN